MNLYLILAMGIVIFVIFIVSVFFMIGGRVSDSNTSNKEEIKELRKKIDELESRIEDS